MFTRRADFAAILFILAGIVECESLTTFGKSNTQQPKPVTPTPPPARSCYRQQECAGISGTSCVRTHYDAVTRCLCGDNLPPINGQCEGQQPKALYHTCTNSGECNDGLICGTPNITGPPPDHLKVISPSDKICLCDTENGYREKEHTCNGANIIKTSLLALIVITCIRKLLNY